MALAGFHWKPISELVTEVSNIADPQSLDANYSAARGLWCAWQWICSLSSSIEDAVILAHGPMGCSSSLMRFGANQVQGFHHLVTTAMGTEQVVLGGEEGLEQAITQVDRDYRPALICIHTNCCSGLNMDDVSGVVERLKTGVHARLFFIPSPGFAACWPGDVARRYLPRYLELMASPERLEKDAINILGVRGSHLEFGMPLRRGRPRTAPDNPAELKRMVEALGLRLHRALLGGTYEGIRTAPQAFANVYDCPTWGYPLGLAMQERFETLHLPHSRCIGVEATVRWLTDLAKATATEAAAHRFINSEYAAVKEVWEKAKEMAKGKVALISGAPDASLEVSRPLAMARFALELGMTPRLYNIHPLAVKSQDYVVDYFREQGVDPLLLADPYPYRQLISDFAAARSLGLRPDEVVYLPGGRLALAAQPYREPWAWAVDSAAPQAQPPQDVGFRGAAALAQEVITSLRAARRGRPTVAERLAASARGEGNLGDETGAELRGRSS